MAIASTNRRVENRLRPENVRLVRSGPALSRADRRAGGSGADANVRFPVKLRTLLGLAFMIGIGSLLYPRAVAAWQLHSAASALADYALCMAGPTGPALLRDRSPAFTKLVRRRLVAQAASTRVFEQCATLAYRLTHDKDVELAHRARAEDFVEYGGAAADRAQAGASRELTLGALDVSSNGISDLSERGWPFVRRGYTRLIKPSRSAREAVHPVPLPRPGLGAGLPAWRATYRSVTKLGSDYWLAVGKGANLSFYKSSDGGKNFVPTSARPDPVLSVAERCPINTEGRSFVFSLDNDSIRLSSLGPDGAPYVTRVASAKRELFAAACDAAALVAGLKAPGAPAVQLMLCPYRRPCAPLPLPEGGPQLHFPLDIARVRGTTVLAMSAHGVVRVASSRDNGRTWMPFSVAFDVGEYPELRHFRPPARLLSLDESVLLYAGSDRPDERYLLLVSEDHGASFRAP